MSDASLTPSLDPELAELTSVVLAKQSDQEAAMNAPTLAPSALPSSSPSPSPSPSASASASASAVAATVRTTAAVFYVDPLHGSPANNGVTLSTAWQRLDAVMAAGKTFVPGDQILLARGHHGAVVVSGVSSSLAAAAPAAGAGEPGMVGAASTVVTIAALRGHTPILQSLVFTGAAANWSVVGPMCITRQAAIVAASHAAGVSVDNTCSHISLSRLSLYSMQDSSAWTAAQWLANRVPMYFNAPYVTVADCHVYNGGNFQADFGAASITATRVILENFPSDAMDLKGAAPTIAGCAIYGSRKVNGNHNDLCQVWARNDGVFAGNYLAAYVDPRQAFLAKPGVCSDCQGFGAYDGMKAGWTVVDNIVRVDHPIGIWFLGAKDCVFANNTVLRCGPTTYFTGPPSATAMRRPCVFVGGSKPLDPATGLPLGPSYGGNVVVNNIAEQYYIPAATGGQANNVTVDGTKLASMFVAPAPPTMDVHIRGGTAAAAALQTGSAAVHGMPVRALVDYDGVALPKSGACTVGALQANTTYHGFVSEPRTVTAAVQTPLGVDVAWTGVAGDRCYAVLANGKRVGLQRTGCTSWFVIGGTTSGVTYTVETLPVVSL